MGMKITNLELKSNNITIDYEVTLPRPITMVTLSFTEEDAKRLGVPFKDLVKIIQEVTDEMRVEIEAAEAT